MYGRLHSAQVQVWNLKHTYTHIIHTAGKIRIGTRRHFFLWKYFSTVLLKLSPDAGNNPCNPHVQGNPTINEVMCNYGKWHRGKVLNTWRKRGSRWNQSVIKKQSSPLSVQINISWFSPKWCPIKRWIITKMSHKKHLMMGKSKELSQVSCCNTYSRTTCR